MTFLALHSFITLLSPFICSLLDRPCPTSMVSYQPLQDMPAQSSTTTLYPPSNEDGPINSRSPFEPKVGEASRLSRTPSPTPSEARELESGAVNWKRLSTKKFWFRREWLCKLLLSSSSKVILRWIQCTISY